MSTAVLLLAAILSQAVAPPSASTPEAKSRAQALLKEGSAFFEQGDYQAALDKFEAAYAIFPSPKLYFNIAQANRDLGRPVEALKAYETFLALAPDASPDALGDARRSIVDLRGRLGQLKVDCWPTESEVTVDGKSVGLTPLREPIWAVPGYHQVTIQHPHFSAAIEKVEVLAGKVQTLTVRLRASATPPPPSVAQAPEEPAPALRAPPIETGDQGAGHSPSLRTYSWVGVGVTGAFVVGAIVAGVLADSKYSNLQKTCAPKPGGCPETQIDGVKSRALVTNILWGLAGGSAIVTGVGFYMDHRETGISVARRF